MVFSLTALAQVNTVEFGQNRVQYKNFRWRYYQTQNFNTYFSQNGMELGKYVAQVAELELPGIEKLMEYGLRRRVNIAVYNNFGELRQSNIGIGLDWQNTGGVTKLVGNKMIVYFDGNHSSLRKQIRQGIARVILENLLFGDDIGEFAGNAVLLNFPQWFTNGFIAYVAENWNAELDQQLKAAIYSGRYYSFNQLAFEKPLLAGQAFWYYIESKYGKDAVGYLLYIARINRSVNRACEQVLGASFKKVLKDFMLYQQRRFAEDNKGRRQSVKGISVAVLEEKKASYYRFQASPRNNNYALVEFKKGIYRVLLFQGYAKPTVLLKSGVRQLATEADPNYPLLAWDPKGTRLAIIYEKEGKTELMVYDLISRIKIRQPLPFERVIDVKYMLDFNTLLLSAVRNGHVDIFTYNLASFRTEQITNDIFDDLDPSYVSFPGKSGIIFSSNRPSANAVDADTAVHSNRYNVFLIDNWNKTADKQISQLTNLKYADARFPMQYNTTHFTFVSDENGISNRYAGFFKTERAGVDSLIYIGADMLRNPDKSDIDSLLSLYEKKEPDSTVLVSLTKDSSYVFPMTNYSYGIQESRIAGDNRQISEVIAQDRLKRLYKLRPDTLTLRRRNVNARPTYFRRYQMHQDSLALGLPSMINKPDTAKKADDFFQSEFSKEPTDTSYKNENVTEEIKTEAVLKKARLFPYRLKFSTDYLIAQLDNSVLINRYQRFTGSGPIQLASPFNGLIRVGVTDLFEDIKFNGGFRFPSTFDGSEYFFSFEYLKKRIDWKGTYYRRVDRVSIDNAYPGKLKTNLVQLDARLPLDQVRSFRASVGFRQERVLVQAVDPASLQAPDLKDNYAQLRLEYVYDNTIKPAINIWNGTRYKVYGELFRLLGNKALTTFNVGFDARHYEQIYKNFIWATRLSGDFSWGDQKLIYYLGGVDNWLFPKFNYNTPINFNESYAFQTLSVNMRGYNQNVKNGNNALLMNTELRLPVFATFIDNPITSDFLRNFQLTSFIDIGTAWNRKLDFKDANYIYYGQPPVQVRVKNGFLGPFVGGYGFGARSTLWGYFMRLDAGWPMNGFFKGKPIWYFALGVDF